MYILLFLNSSYVVVIHVLVGFQFNLQSKEKLVNYDQKVQIYYSHGKKPYSNKGFMVWVLIFSNESITITHLKNWLQQLVGQVLCLKNCLPFKFTAKVQDCLCWVLLYPQTYIKQALSNGFSPL